MRRAGIWVKIAMSVFASDETAIFYISFAQLHLNSALCQGIVVTSPLRWPSTRGFSFCTWVRVESFPVGGSPKAPEGMMGIFSFLSESGKGCTATISSDQLVVEVISSFPSFWINF